jgi:hypothetical protein
MRCPKCRFEGMTRTKRRGIFEKRILPLFGCFPWRCPACDKQTWLRLRSSPATASPQESAD